jgi:signal transduction histidine kinase
VNRWRRVSLRAKITAAFTVVVIGGTAISTVIGSRIIEDALLDEARARNTHGLSVARMLYDEALDTTRGAVESRLRSGTPDASRLDLFRASSIAGDSTAADPCLASPSVQLLSRMAREGKAATSTEILSAECVGGGGPALALVAVVPDRDGVAFGARLLNERTDVVDRVKRLVYGDSTHDGHAVGAASILLRDVRVATSIMTPDGQRAVGDRGDANDYVSASEPLRNAAGDEVGALQVSMLQAPILAQRTNVMLTFFVVCGIGLAVVFVITYLITRRMISPLEEMVGATKKIGAGDLSVRVSVASDGEIHDLAESFNEMLASLQAMKSELEQWGGTLELRVKQRTEELVTAQQRMAQAEKLASIGRLAAGVAHSINNPLGGILSLSMLALEDVDRSSRLHADLETISKQALRCREIVKGLLDFSRESEARVVRADVSSLVESALSLLERQGTFAGVTLVRQYHDGETPVLIDPGRLQEAISNLAENAVDAMAAGGTLTVQTAVANNPDEIVIRVSDTGPGIPSEVMPYLFEPFFTTKRVGKGTGLGLAIVHGIVTGAGGRIDVTSVPGATTFTVRLPLAADTTEYGADLAGSGDRQPVAGR